MSSVSRYADEHTLYIISGAARNEDLKSAVFRAIKKYEKEHRRKLPCEIIANLIYDREGLPYGFGYLYLSNPQVYHMLLGKNPDGSERTEIIEKDLDYLPLSDLDFDIPWFDWADAAEEIEIRSLPPLMTLPSFYYRKEQKEQLKKLVEKLKVSERKQLDPDQFDDTMCTFKLDAGLVKPVDEKYSAHILCAQGVPEWLTGKDIYNRFRRFVSNKNKNDRGKVYPLISINKKNKMVFVEFDSNTRDAQFALLMTTKLNFEFTDSFRSGKNHLNKTLIFTHAFRSNRK